MKFRKESSLFKDRLMSAIAQNEESEHATAFIVDQTFCSNSRF